MVTATLQKVRRNFQTDALSKALLFAVPSISARTLGLYRILFFSVFLSFFLLHVVPHRLGALADGSPRFFLNSWPLLRDLSGQAQVQSALYYAVVACLLFLIVGLFTRVAAAGLVVAFWLTVLMMNDGHFVTPLLLAVTVTANARWGDGLSLDRLLFRRGGSGDKSRVYGYPIWLMGLCISLAYTSAGLSKVYLTGGAWIWEGGTRWGFMVDMKEAVTLWGPMIVNHLPLAVAASIFAALGQAIYVYSCFTKSLLIKSGIGLFVAVPFLVGLVLFMGLFWWPWFILVVFWYLPWSKVGDLLGGDRAGATEHAGESAQKNWATGAAAALILGHAYAVASDTELEPLISNYPMYAVAYPMGSEWEEERWQDYEAHNPSYVYEISVEAADGSVTDISQSFRTAFFLVRAFQIPSPHVVATPSSVWLKAEQAEAIPPGLCGAMRQVLIGFDPVGEPANLVYNRRYFDLVDGKILWMDGDRRLRVAVGPGRCGYVWVENEA